MLAFSKFIRRVRNFEAKVNIYQVCVFCQVDVDPTRKKCCTDANSKRVSLLPEIIITELQCLWGIFTYLHTNMTQLNNSWYNKVLGPTAQRSFMHKHDDLNQHTPQTVA